MNDKNVNYKISLTDLFTPKIKGAINETNKLNSAVGSLGNKLLKRAFAGIGVAMFANEIYKAGTQVEQLNVAFKTMLGSKEKADALMGDMATFAKTTPFELSEVTTAGKQLLAFGIESENIISTMRALGDVSSGISAPIGDIAYLFGTIKTQGRAMTMDINQFANRGIPIWDELSKVVGLSGAGLKKYVEEGKVGFEEIDKVFKNLSGSGGKFFNLMAEQSLTLGGRVSNLKDQFFDLSVTIFEMVKPALSDLIDVAVNLISSIKDFTETIKDNWSWISKLASAVIGVTAAWVAYEAITIAVSTFIAAKGLYAIWSLASALGGVTMAQSALNLATAVFSALTGNWVGLAAGAAVLAAGIWATVSAYKALNTETGKYNGENNLGKALGNNQFSMVNPSGTFGKKQGASAEQEKTKKSGTSLSAVEARTPQNFNISINKLVESVNFTTNNLKESGANLKAEVERAMITAINDFQIMATK